MVLEIAQIYRISVALAQICLQALSLLPNKMEQ